MTSKTRYMTKARRKKMTSKTRYMTKAISEEVSVELQAILWQLYDEILEQRKEQMDYLQVIEINAETNALTIMNRQEEPLLKRRGVWRIHLRICEEEH